MTTPPSSPGWRQRLERIAATSKNVAKDTAQNAGAAIKDRERPVAPPKKRFEPTSWHGALLVMTAAAALLWVVQIINASVDYRLNDEVALQPRQLGGLWGIVAAPFLHTGWFHVLSNTPPFILIGWVVLLAGVRGLVITTVITTLLGGALAWLVAPSGTVLGAGLLIIGWMGYLLARAFFSRSVKWILVAVLVLFFFGTLLGALVPHFDRGISWEAYVAYFVAGVAAAAVLHYRRRAGAARGRAPRRNTVRGAADA